MNEADEPAWLTRLEHDHQVIHQQLAVLSEALRQCEHNPDSLSLHATLGRVTRFFQYDLPWHIRLEEEALFPAVIPVLGQTQGPLVAIRMEHQQLPQIVTAWAQAWEQFTEAPMQVRLLALQEAARRLQEVLEVHIHKEEQVLFVLLRKLLKPQDWGGIQERAQALVGRWEKSGTNLPMEVWEFQERWR